MNKCVNQKVLFFCKFTRFQFCRMYMCSSYHSKSLDLEAEQPGNLSPVFRKQM
jgi:hypothetical protein